MTKYRHLMNILQERLGGDEEACEALDQVLEIVKEQGYDEGWNDRKAEEEEAKDELNDDSEEEPLLDEGFDE